jgi:predicted ArsR family transcriptional regulator
VRTDAHSNETRRHRALAHPRRAQIVDELERRQAGADVESLARAAGLHPNTARWHLGVLADAGIVHSHAEARGKPGRPRVVWQMSTLEPAPPENHRLLATILTGVAGEWAEGIERAEAAGRAWGRFLVERPPPHVSVTDDDAISGVVALLDHEGFSPERDGSAIRMGRCPFRDLAETHGHVVCPIHRGLVSGALAELGSTLTVGSLEPFAEPNVCVARLEPT